METYKKSMIVSVINVDLKNNNRKYKKYTLNLLGVQIVTINLFQVEPCNYLWYRYEKAPQSQLTPF